MPHLGAGLLGQFERALHVREQDRHLLALALEGGARLQDPLGEMARCVVARRTLDACHLFLRGLRTGDLGTALCTELRGRGQLAAAARTAHGDGRSAFEAELRAQGIRVAAGGAVHGARHSTEVPASSATSQDPVVPLARYSSAPS